MAIAKLLFEAGAKDNQTAMNECLMLAMSGRLCRELGVQTPLLGLLCAYEADASTGIHSALAHKEFEAGRTLIGCGAAMTLAAAATLDERQIVNELIETAKPHELQPALSLAASAGRTEIVKTLLSAGADPNRYNPPGGHSHCTPLHSAVANNLLATVKVLVSGGADVSMKDIHHSATAYDWAQHQKHQAVAEYLASTG